MISVCCLKSFCDCLTLLFIEKLPKVKNGSPCISSLLLANCKPTNLSPNVSLPKTPILPCIVLYLNDFSYSMKDEHGTYFVSPLIIYVRYPSQPNTFEALIASCGVLYKSRII